MDSSLSIGAPSSSLSSSSLSIEATQVGAVGSEGIQDPKKERAWYQSQSLSEYRLNYFKEELSSENFQNLVYVEDPDLPNIKVQRFTIINREMPQIKNYGENEFSAIEIKVFTAALHALFDLNDSENLMGIEITNRPIPNNVVLIDFFDTKKTFINDEISYTLKEDEASAEGEAGKIAIIHTTCFWKKKARQIVVIDPSNSTYSERLKNLLENSAFEHYKDQNYTLDIATHSEDVFYKLPQQSQPKTSQRHQQNASTKKSSQQSSSKTSDTLLSSTSSSSSASSTSSAKIEVQVETKSRDCIDIALKIAIVINQSHLIYSNINAIQHSINLLSNQSAVNPILGETNDCTLVKHLQSTSEKIRFRVMMDFNSIPPFSINLLFWKELQIHPHFDVIIKTLNIFYKELKAKKFKLDSEKAVTDLLRLSTQTNLILDIRNKIDTRSDDEKSRGQLAYFGLPLFSSK